MHIPITEKEKKKNKIHNRKQTIMIRTQIAHKMEEKGIADTKRGGGYWEAFRGVGRVELRQ